MIYSRRTFPQYAVDAEIASFTHAGGIGEFHAMFHIGNKALPYTAQLNHLLGAYREFVSEKNTYKPVIVRFFVTDAANQAPQLKERIKELPVSAVSIVEQPLLSGGKIGMWAYMLDGDVETGQESSGMFRITHGAYQHYWTAGQVSANGNSDEQTTALFGTYETNLRNLGCNIADNCIRTWLYVRDVDVNYAGVVKARRENFIREGLTQHTHYIASTGIEGRSENPDCKVIFDAYSVKGIGKDQVRYLYAPTHLSPTHVYGVTFERGVALQFGDRRHIYISGTASIDNEGNVVHPGNIRKQTDRMCVNVEKLLDEAGATPGNLAHILVYLRDLADYPLVSEMMEDWYPNVPRQFLLAPVCRPAWLIEMECVAIVPQGDVRFGGF